MIRIVLAFVALSTLCGGVSAKQLVLERSISGGFAKCAFSVPGGAVSLGSYQLLANGIEASFVVEKGSVAATYTLSVSGEKTSYVNLGRKRAYTSKGGQLKIAEHVTLLVFCSVRSIPAAQNCNFTTLNGNCTVCAARECERVTWSLKSNGGETVTFEKVTNYRLFVAQ